MIKAVEETRRDFLLVGAAGLGFAPILHAQKETEMYGLIGKMLAVEGKRDALIEILLESVDEMPGCLSYVVAKDPADANALWITEVWDDKASHDASITLPKVKAAIAKGRPLIAGFGERFVTTPLGGYGRMIPKSR